MTVHRLLAVDPTSEFMKEGDGQVNERQFIRTAPNDNNSGKLAQLLLLHFAVHVTNNF